MTEPHQTQHDPETLKAFYLDIFRANRAAILEAAERGFDPPIKGCPSWDVAGLTAHMGRVYTFWLKWVSERPRGYSREAMAEVAADRDARLPGYTAWDRAGFPKESQPEGIIPYTREAGDELDAALVDLGPQETVWTFVPPQQNGAFVFRRLCMETGIHRWDAEQAHGIDRPFDDDLARDGIDEMLMMFRDDPAYEENKERRQGQRILLREEPGACRWLVAFDRAGITASAEEGPADAIVAGSASDLWLFIMGRRSVEEMRVEGDRELAASWGDLAGRF